MHHFFVDTDSFNPMLTKEVAGLNPTISTPESITQFLTLPMIIAWANPWRRLIDPVVDFTKSVMLTSDGYLNAVEQLQEKRNQAVRIRERSRTDKAELKRRKLLEREEEKRQREAWAMKVLQRPEVTRAKALECTEAERKKAQQALFRA